MNEFYPYLSVDIETSGLPDENPEILQLAATFDDLRSDFDSLLRFNCIIDPGPILTGNLYALSLNNWILKEILKHRQGKYTKIPVLSLEQAISDFTWFVDRCKRYAGLKAKTRLTLAGKNAAGFDVPILKENGFDELINKNFTHRVLDPGSLYLPQFGKVPNLDEISEFCGLGKVTHDAQDDADRVVEVIRQYLHTESIRDKLINDLENTKAEVKDEGLSVVEDKTPSND